MGDDIRSFDQFYPHYLGHHAHPANRLLHVFSSLAGLALLIAFFVTGKWWCLFVAPLVGYGFAFLGHFLFERNHPTAFRYPLWSFAADWRMVGEILIGRLSLFTRSSDRR